MRNRYAIDGEERRSIPMSFKIRPSHKEKLTKLSLKEDRSVTYLVEKALIEYFKIKKV